MSAAGHGTSPAFLLRPPAAAPGRAALARAAKGQAATWVKASGARPGAPARLPTTPVRTMATDVSVGIPSADGTCIAAAGEHWDAVKLPRALGAAALSSVAGEPGAVVVSAGNRSLYFLIPPGSATAWNLPPAVVLGATSHIALPPPHRQQPPGPYWLISPRAGRLHTHSGELLCAVEIALGIRPGRAAAEQPDLAHLTDTQIRGVHCAICHAPLGQARRLGTFWTGEGVLAEPTDLWACDPSCSPPSSAAARSQQTTTSAYTNAMSRESATSPTSDLIPVEQYE